MIVFDLSCERGHVFEAWFGSSEDYEGQKARGLVSCPICNSANIDKAVMAPRIARKGNQQTLPALTKAGNAVAMANDGPTPQQAKAMLEALARGQAEMLKNSDWVGTRFADEARAMHVGDREHRAIHGQATLDEARTLIEEGVPVGPLPFLVRPPSEDN